MNKLSGALLIAASASLMVNAVAAPINLSAQDATPLVFTYLHTIGCPDDETLDPKRFAKFSDPALKISGYVASVTADTSCTGGNGTVGSTLVFLGTNSGRAIENMMSVRVRPEMSEPVAWVYNSPKAVTSLYQKGGQLYATGLEHGKGDANCCPSIKTLYKVSLQRRAITVEKDEVRDVYSWKFFPVR